jgi:hypothetical protein
LLERSVNREDPDPDPGSQLITVPPDPDPLHRKNRKNIVKIVRLTPAKVFYFLDYASTVNFLVVQIEALKKVFSICKL